MLGKSLLILALLCYSLSYASAELLLSNNRMVAVLEKYLPPTETLEALSIVRKVQKLLPNEKSQLYTAIYFTDAARFFKDKYNDSGFLLMKILRIVLLLAEHNPITVDSQLSALINTIEFVFPVKKTTISNLLTEVEEVLKISPEASSHLFSNISSIIQNENNKKPQLRTKQNYILKLILFSRLYLETNHENSAINILDTMKKIQTVCFMYANLTLNILFDGVKISRDKTTNVLAKFLSICDWLMDEYFDDILAEILDGIVSTQMKAKQNCEIEFVDVLESYVNVFDKNLHTRNEILFVDYINAANKFACTS